MRNRKTKYIPHLAEFYFKPDYDWSIKEASNLYDNSNHLIKNIDTINYNDCIEGMNKIPDQSIDLIIADPPFGIEFNGKGSQYNRNQDLVIEDYGEIIENYDSFTSQWISKLPRIMKDTSSVYIISGWTNLKDILNAIEENNLKLINHILWKYQFGVFTKNKFVTEHYHILFVVKNEKKYFFNKIEHYPSDVWEIPRKYDSRKEKNGTKLPEDLILRMIDFSSGPGDLVLDPFMGNGTTAIVAKKNFRHFLGFEKNIKMKSLIQSKLNLIKTGSDYISYIDKLKTPEELSQIDNSYYRAFQEYKKREMCYIV